MFKICTENVQINTIKNGLNKDLVLGDPLPPLMVKDHNFALFKFGPFPKKLSAYTLHGDSNIKKAWFYN